MKYSMILMMIGFITGCAEPDPIEALGSTNQAPVITEIVSDPPAIRIGGTCTITVKAKDLNDGGLSYTWSASAGDIIGKGSSIRYTASFCCAGFNTVKVVVKNNRGGSTTQRIEIYVN